MVFAQSTVTGKVTDNANNPLANAIVNVKGNTTTVKTSEDGSFKIVSKENKGTVVVSFLGFEVSSVSFDGNQDLGTISLVLSTSEIEEVVVKSTTVDVAKSRKTPVAVSTIKAAEIQEKLGNQEFPEMLNNTPSVYATKSGGGFGDSRVNIRGFDQRNIAVLINGVPVNDMENSAVYWSNWAGLSDVTSAMQVQRGLGSSKLAISSVGGTINVITKSSDQKEGGVFASTFGNDEYLKNQFAYNTGKMKNGLSASFLMSRTTGDGYVDGTKFEGHNYFIALGYELNDKHDFQFTFTGAPQWHNQRSFANTIATYKQYGTNGEPNIKYNSDWGYLNGEEYSWARNFYHKPIMSFNWDYKISDKMKLSSVLYGSWGRGGGTGNIGKSPFAYKTVDGLVPFDDFVAFNQGNYSFPSGNSTTNIGTDLSPNSNGEYVTNRSTGFTRRASINSHDWYGGVINLNTKLTEKITLDFGVDARTYIGYHFRNINDRLGASVYTDNTDINNPGRSLYQTYAANPSLNPFTNIKNQEKIEYNNNGYVRWLGAFTQLEYSTDKLSAFIQGSVSQQGFRREDTFLYLESNPLYKTDYKNLIGGNIKGGANYNFDEKNNMFVNAGYYSKQPFFNAVYPNNKSIVNENLTNEKILGLEAGYGFKSSKFNANLNIYHTTWTDRYQRSSDNAATNQGGYYDFAGIQEVHDGVELEFTVKPLPKLNINGMFSYGNWYYKNNVTSNRFDINNTQIGNGSTLYLDNVKVGDAAQTTAALGFSYEVLTRVKLDANYRYIDRLYASIDPSRFTTEINKGSLELPSYGLMDLGFSYKMLVGKDKQNSVNFRFNLNNVLDTVYIAESRTNIFASDNVSSSNASLGTYESNGRTWNGVADANQVFFGFGRTSNFTVTYRF